MLGVLREPVKFVIMECKCSNNGYIKGHVMISGYWSSSKESNSVVLGEVTQFGVNR